MRELDDVMKMIKREQKKIDEKFEEYKTSKLKVYVLVVAEDDFEYDQINNVVVIASNDEQAKLIAENTRNVNWEVEEFHEIDSAKLVAKYIHHG